MSSDRASAVRDSTATSTTPESRAGVFAIDANLEAFAFGARQVLQDIKLAVAAGEAVAVLGPSGCGKSTLIRVLAGLLPRSSSDRLSGHVKLFGSSPQTYRVAARLSVMFQDPTLLPHLTVRQNIDLPLRLLGRTSHEETDALLQLVGLDPFGDYLPRDLSGGMRTRTSLARGFVTGPELLLMDEPFTGLDLGWKESLYRSLQNLRYRSGATAVLVTHDLEEAIYNSSRVLVMSHEGMFIEEFAVSDPFPRDYPFGETVSRHTTTLTRLARLLSPSSLRLA